MHIAFRHRPAGLLVSPVSRADSLGLSTTLLLAPWASAQAQTADPSAAPTEGRPDFTRHHLEVCAAERHGRPRWPRTHLAMLAGWVVIACLPAAQAQAQPRPGEPTATLPTVTINAEAERADGPVSGYAARRSATATKTDTPLNEVPQSISVITADQVRDQGSPNLQEALRYTAGMRTEQYGVDNRGDWLALRGGSGATVIDGMRRPLTGWWGIIRSEPYAFERIEVLRGPSSVMAGQNGPGGVVNLVSKRPQAERTGEIGVQIGNHGHQQVQFDLTGPLNADGTLLYRLVGLGKRSDTQVQHAFDERELFAPSITWRPSAATSLHLYAQHQRDESGNLNAFFPADGTLLPAPHGPIPTDTFISEPAFDTYGGTRSRVGWAFEQHLNEQWTLRQNLRQDRTDGTMRSMYAAWWDGFVDASGKPDANGTHLNRYFYAADDKDRTTNAELMFEGKLKSGSVVHTVLAGVDGFQSRASRRDYGEVLASPLDVYNPVYGGYSLPALPDVPDTVTRTRMLGLVLQDQIKFNDRWVLVAGLRRDRSRSAVEGGASQTDKAISKNLGAVWLAGGGWSPYASYSESFEPVAGTDAAGQLFKPKRGQQVEAGVKWQPSGSRLNATASVYQLREKNRTASDPLNPGFSVQRGEVTVKGMEFELAGQIANWDLTGQYTYTDAQVTSTTADEARYLGQQLEAIPRHSAGLWAVYRFAGLPGLRLGGGIRHVGRSSDGVGDLQVPSVELFDAMLSYDTRDWRFALNINNLADKRYVASCLERGDCWFGQARRVVLSATYRY